MKTLSTLSALAQNETLRNIAHDIRLSCAVYHIETARFGPDARENLTISPMGKILTNLYQMGTAQVSHNGTVVHLRSRSAARAAACLALRLIRNGTVPMGGFDVSQRNARGASYSETFEFVPVQDETVDSDGLNRANIVRAEMGHVSNRRIDDVTFDSETPARETLSPMTAEERSANNWERAMERKAAREAAK